MMYFQLPITGHFGCLALQTHISDSQSVTLSLGNGLYASSQIPFAIDEFWQESLGTIEAKHISQCNLFLFAVSDDSEISERALLWSVNRLYYSLLLQGKGYSVRNVSLSGRNSASGMKVETLGRLPDYHRPAKVAPKAVDATSLLNTGKIARGIETLFADEIGDEYLRLRKGFNALLEGTQKSHPNETHQRLHQFVRAIEAVIRPKQGEGTSKFIYRCGFFAGRTQSEAKLLGELYEMRCAAEHLNPLSEKLTAYPPDEHDKLKVLRTYQSELLASFVYRNILSDATILSAFKSEQSITDLWANDTRTLISFWGNTIDLDLVGKDGFLDYLF